MPFLDRSTLTYPATNSFPGRRWLDKRNPTSSDFKNFEISDIWINDAALTAWIMVDRTATAGFWIQMASSGTGILTITGNSGGAIPADAAHNINIVGSSLLTISGNAGTNTLTATLGASVATTFVEDAGSATPSANILNIVGGTGVSTSGAGNTVTINAMSSVPLTFTADVGSAVPVANDIIIAGTGGIATSGAGQTVTVTANGSVIGKTITGDTGGALSPTAGNWNILGGTGISTSGSGSTLTVNSIGGGVKWTEVTVLGPTTMAINNGYVTNNAGTRVQLTIPVTVAFGSVFRIVGKGAAGWQINQQAGQSIILEGSSTTVGGTGTLKSTGTTDSVELLCTTANTVFTIISGVGNYTFT